MFRMGCKCFIQESIDDCVPMAMFLGARPKSLYFVFHAWLATMTTASPATPLLSVWTGPSLRFDLMSECKQSLARSCRIFFPKHCPNGPVETPVYMPVGTQGTVKGVTVTQLEKMDCRILLGNTYHLGHRPGPEVISKVSLVPWNSCTLNIIESEGPMPSDITVNLIYNCNFRFNSVWNIWLNFLSNSYNRPWVVFLRQSVRHSFGYTFFIHMVEPEPLQVAS